MFRSIGWPSCTSTIGSPSGAMSRAPRRVERDPTHRDGKDGDRRDHRQRPRHGLIALRDSLLDEITQDDEQDEVEWLAAKAQQPTTRVTRKMKKKMTVARMTRSITSGKIVSERWTPTEQGCRRRRAQRPRSLPTFVGLSLEIDPASQTRNSAPVELPVYEEDDAPVLGGGPNFSRFGTIELTLVDFPAILRRRRFQASSFHGERPR